MTVLAVLLRLLGVFVIVAPDGTPAAATAVLAVAVLFEAIALVAVLAVLVVLGATVRVHRTAPGVTAPGFVPREVAPASRPRPRAPGIRFATGSCG